MKVDLSSEEISNLINRVVKRISRLELWLYHSKFSDASKYGEELETLRKLKIKLIAVLRENNDK